MLNLIYRNCSEFSKFSALISEYLSLKGEDDEETEFNVRLAICELAGNIIKHSKSVASVTLFMEGDYINISITGSHSFLLEETRLPPPDSECGRGIYIVKNICENLKYENGGREVFVAIRRRSCI